MGSYINRKLSLPATWVSLATLIHILCHAIFRTHIKTDSVTQKHQTRVNDSNKREEKLHCYANIVAFLRDYLLSFLCSLLHTNTHALSYSLFTITHKHTCSVFLYEH